MTAETIEKRFPNFHKAAAAFCRDKNAGEEGMAYIAAAWTDPKEFGRMFDENQVFTANELREFEEKYLDGVSDDEMQALDDASAEAAESYEYDADFNVDY